MQYTGIQVFSFIVLLIGTGLVIVSIATNYWSYDVYDVKILNTNLFGFKSSRRGLWEQCYLPLDENSDPTCQNRYQDVVDSVKSQKLNEVHSKFHPWEVACLGLICGSALLGIIMLMLSPCCCTRCGWCLAVFVFIAALEACSCIGIYVYHQLTAQSTGLAEKYADVQVVADHFGYSFWCAVAGAACQLLASILFAVSRCCDRSNSYSHTI